MKLTDPIKLGSQTLKNRIMFPPLSTGYEERDGSIGKRSFSFYTRLAKGGVGYIVIGDVSPVATISPTPRLYMDSQIPSFKALADSLHSYGAKLGLQIFHPEYDCEGVTERVLKTWGMMAQVKKLAEEGKKEESDALAIEAAKVQKDAYGYLHTSMMGFANNVSKEDLQKLLGKMTDAVIRAKKAGVDAIEIHGDRLVGSLCSTRLNKRTDEYGGSFENRIRFALEVVRSFRKAAPDMILEYKLPVITVDDKEVPTGKGGLFLEEAVELAKILEKEGVDAIHVGQANHTGNNNDTIPSMGTREYAFMLKYVKAIKEAVSIPVSTAGRIISSHVAQAMLDEGIIDYAGLGRSLLTDPDIANKISEGKEDEIRQCIMCNKGCTDAIAGKGAYKWVSCVLNAENGFEGERNIVKASNPREIAVVGAGIAGCEAARVLALKGHKVTLYEASYRLGGQINLASIPPRKEEMLRSLRYFETILPRLGVNVKFGHPFTKEDAKTYKDIVVATGAEPLVPNIPGIHGSNVVAAWDVLDNKAIPFGKIAVMGGGLVGAETAEYLANKGYKVTIIEMLDKIAAQESPTILPTMLADFEKHGVVQLTKSKIAEINLQGVVVDHLDENGQPASRETIPADLVVNALASKKHLIDLEGVDANIVYVGDCAGEKPSVIDHAIKTAYDAANALN